MARNAFAGGIATDNRVAIIETQIAAADARRLDLDQHFAGSRIRHFDGADLDPLIARQEDGLHPDNSSVAIPTVPPTRHSLSLARRPFLGARRGLVRLSLSGQRPKLDRGAGLIALAQIPNS